ncbi:hypothetical protein E2C01_063387 [Portunus trituberculatus]|uniref:Uncharacterized protein n=1 Tax=Portunus trituberculatus TaxID=210409 RepID=A0A5B7HDJ5_PORTR|nr:hypothetical protein [Portunus trituberculatus]
MLPEMSGRGTSVMGHGNKLVGDIWDKKAKENDTIIFFPGHDLLTFPPEPSPRPVPVYVRGLTFAQLSDIYIY